MSDRHDAPPRVLMATFRYPPLGDGLEKQAHALAAALKRRAVTVTVLTARGRGLPQREIKDGVRVVRLPCPAVGVLGGQSAGALILSASAWAFMAKHRSRFEIVHCHAGVPYTAVVLLAARLLGAPCLVKIAASGNWSDLLALRSGRYGILGRLVLPLLHLADRFVVLNAEASAELISAVGEARVTRIPNGVAAPSSRWSRSTLAARRAELGVSAADNLVLAVGRLDPQKGFDVLIEACSGPGGPHLVILGEGPQHAALAALARARGTRLTMPGRVSPARVSAWMRAASLVAAPSRAEGMSNVLLEALSVGCPVVASRVPGNVDLVIDGLSGLLVQPEDPVGLRDAITRLLDDPALGERLGQVAVEKIPARYSIETVAAAYETLYRELAHRGARPARSSAQRSDRRPATSGLRSARRWWNAVVDPGRIPASRRQRLIILAGSLTTDMVGGTQLQVERAAEHLSQDFDVVVLSRALRVEPGIEERGGYRVLRRPVLPWTGPRLIVDVLLSLWQLRVLARPGSLLLGYQTITSGLVAVLAGRALGRPSILCIRAELEYRDDLRDRAVASLSRLAWRLADRLLLQAPVMRDAFLDAAASIGLSATALANRVGVVPNGIDVPDRQAAGTDLIFIGRLHPMKGLNVLVEALRRIDPSRRPTLTIVGDGPLMAELRGRTADLPVSLIGELPRQQALERAARAGIFVFPATGGDGMPNAVLEAMALGLAVITTPVAGIPDLIRDGENGLLVPVGDSSALADAIVRVLEDAHLRYRLGQNARSTAAAYSWGSVRQQLLSELERAAAAFDNRLDASTPRSESVARPRSAAILRARATTVRKTTALDS